MTLGIGGRQHGLADPAQSVQCGDRCAALVVAQPRLDRAQRILTPHKMRWHPYPGHGDRDHFAKKRRRCRVRQVWS